MLTEPITERHMLPRWRTFKHALALNELIPQHAPAEKLSVPENILTERLENWEDNKTLSYAVELTEASIFSSRPQIASEAAYYILNCDPEASGSARFLADKILFPAVVQKHDQPEESPELNRNRAEIVFLKSRTRANQRNPFAWADLAYYYGKNGLLVKAKRALEIALNLAPESRFITRSLVRLFTHSGDIDFALSVVRSRKRLKGDPWLMAAEIAVADLAGKSSLIIKDGLRILKDDNIHPFHISELSSAIATIEISHGANKKARKLFSSAMRAPTENTCAQFEWAVKNHIITRPDGLVCAAPGDYEAQSYVHFSESDWDSALKCSWLWCLDQPFSLDAASWGSYLASVAVGDCGAAMKIAEFGLKANLGSWLLKNNLAFSLAKSDHADKALSTLNSIKPPKDDGNALATILATSGLISFRRGNSEDGRESYRLAIDHFDKNRDFKASFTAKAYWLIEEARIKSNLVDPLLLEVEELAEKVKRFPEVKAISAKVQEELTKKRGISIK